MYFQAKVAALVSLTAFCVGLTEGFLLILLYQLRAKSMEELEVALSRIGKESGLFYLHTYSSEIEFYNFLNLKLPVFLNWISEFSVVSEVRKYNNRI